MISPEIRQIIGAAPSSISSQAADASFLFTATGADVGYVKVDMAGFSVAREIHLTGKTVTNTTPPGSSKTLTVSYAWSDEDFTPAAAAATLLADRKTTLTAKTIGNNASETLQWRFTGATPLRVEARYLLVYYNLTALAASATLTGAINVAVVPSAAADV